MAKALDLMRVILDIDDLEDGLAADMLHRALEAEADPMEYCVLAGLVSEGDAMERAAHWLGLAYFQVVPGGLVINDAAPRPQALGEVRSLRLKVFERDVLFCAPDFFQLLHMANGPNMIGRVCLVPVRELRGFVAEIFAPMLLDNARQGLVRQWPWAAAHLELTRGARRTFVAGLILVTLMVLLSPFLTYPVLMPLALALIAVPAILTLAALLDELPAPGDVDRPDDAELPVYSILIPLRDEAHMVPQLARAMLALDYPHDRLDIKFVVEARSATTVAAARAQQRRGPFSVVEVPDAAPHTKPKAISYALPLCRGEHVVVFDAEDTPHPTQLWRAALRFRDDPSLQCLQAPLVIDNVHDGLLATLFAGEYAGLFGVKLPALAGWDLPVPLGGTSNHFRTATLRGLGGWDAYNVTEDADLGVRLARRRLKVGMLGVPTYEEAPNRLRTWMAQRTRWMKGWMQTFVVHNRRPWQTLRDMGWRRFLVFEIMTLSQIMAPLLHTAFILQMAGKLALGMSLFGQSLGWEVLYPSMLVLGYGAAMAQAMIGIYRIGWKPSILVQLLLPFYWVLMAIATVRALHDLLERPFHWAKTPHRTVARKAARAPVRTAMAMRRGA